ncbi:MAG TPA: uracil-DNA glycosylase [Chitinophagales bacterium]|nr:uracil-DNA glycosylase [Chitinophagales bacterium]HQU39732.1 uracil-DNA glycosylase [Chitinophagales bacterium]HRX23296.1 uracil-DNA glycosylase [Chitinophagales bacterium]
MAREDIQLEAGWKAVLADEFDKAYFQQIRYLLLAAKRDGKVIFPPGSQIFNAYNLTPFEQVKVVILGQDPYHGPGQAHGLCFSVPEGVKPPPSLVNIFKEQEKDLGIPRPAHGNLETWARQGVFLLNAMLTVESGKPGSHQQIGWQYFTDATIKALSENKEHLVFLLWGAFAQKKAELIDAGKHLILQAAHPSPFSADRGFFGCRHFSKANTYLQEHGMQKIDWKLAN